MCSRFGSRTVNRYRLWSPWGCVFSVSLRLVGNVAVSNGPKHRAEVPSGSPEHRGSCIFQGKLLLEKLHSGLSHRAVGHEFAFSELTAHIK